MRRFILFLLVLTIIAAVPVPAITPQAQISPKPIGLASYGIYSKGANSTYTITTNQIIGYFNISSINSFNPNSPEPYYATLQLGGTVNNSMAVNWLQEELVFNTLNDTFFIGCYYNGNQKFNTTLLHFSLPLAGYLIISLIYNQTFTIVKYQYVIIQNGSRFLPPEVRTAIVSTIHGRAFFTVNFPTKENVELVFGGFNSVTNFTSLNSELGLFYNQSGLKPFPSVFNFGMNATGSAEDLITILEPDGNVEVTTGSPSYGLITSNYNPPIPPLTFVNESFIINRLGIYQSKDFYIDKPYNITIPNVLGISSNVYLYLEKVIGQTYIIPNNSTFQTFDILLYYDEKVMVTIVYPNSSAITYNLPVNTTVTLPRIINISNNEILVLQKNVQILVTNSTPSIINTSTYYVPEYLVRITYPNGTTIMNWYQKGTVLQLPQYIYETPHERFELVGKNIINVSSPLNVLPPYQLEYEVSLDYGNFNVTYWAKNGQLVTLNAYIPLFYEGEWEGTYNVPVGGTVVVNQYIIERLVLSPNIALISLLALISASVVLVLIFWHRIRKIL
ncbi:MULTISPECIES: thermopsin family protease [unclassified Stygiolobus]|uniref:thermopsin family protease n=1 Tax=unclassified Stygiolobus TaxID=2824672 RepID=UPI00307D1827